MANYKVLIKAKVVADYEAIASKVDRRRVLGKIAVLTVDPRPAQAEQLPGRQNQYRICLDHHRLVYETDNLKKQVTIYGIAARRRQNSAW